MENNINTPFGLRFLIMLLNVIICIGLLYFQQTIFIPIAFSVLIAILLYPICKKLEKHKISRLFAIIITMSAIFSIASTILIMLSAQMIELSKQIPAMGNRIMALLEKIMPLVEKYLHISPSHQIDLLNQTLSKSLESGGQMIGTLLSSTTNFFSTIFLIALYVFLLLYYRDLFSNFWMRVIPEDEKEDATDLLNKVDHVIYNYISGLMIVMAIVAVLNIVGLKLLGIEYAIFFGLLGALLTIIPYFGIFIGAIFPTLIAFATYDSIWYPLGVIGVFSIVQFLEGNIITPKITGSKVQVNAMAAIVSLTIGGELWGASGMILALPFVAILKILCDKIPSLQPLGYLLGGEIHEEKESVIGNLFKKYYEKFRLLLFKKDKLK